MSYACSSCGHGYEPEAENPYCPRCERMNQRVDHETMSWMFDVVVTALRRQSRSRR